MNENIESIIKGYSIDYDSSLFDPIIDDFKQKQQQKQASDDEEKRKDRELRGNLAEIGNPDGTPQGGEEKLREAQQKLDEAEKEAQLRKKFIKKQKEEAAAAEKARKEKEEARALAAERAKIEAEEASALAAKRDRREKEAAERERILEEEHKKLESAKDSSLKVPITGLEDLNEILGDRYNYIKKPECIKLFKTILENTVTFVKEKLTGDGNTEGEKDRFIKGDVQELFLKSFKLVKFKGKEIRIPDNNFFEEKLYSFIRDQEKKSVEENCMRDYNIVYTIIEYCLFILGNKNYKKYKISFLKEVQNELDKIKENTGINDLYRFIEMKKKYDSLQDCIISPFNNLQK